MQAKLMQHFVRARKPFSSIYMYSIEKPKIREWQHFAFRLSSIYRVAEVWRFVCMKGIFLKPLGTFCVQKNHQKLSNATHKVSSLESFEIQTLCNNSGAYFPLSLRIVRAKLVGSFPTPNRFQRQNSSKPAQFYAANKRQCIPDHVTVFYFIPSKRFGRNTIVT